MNETILLVGHGSREPAGNTEIEEFARRWRARQPDWNVQACFIEFAEPLVDEGLARAAEHGGRVIVVPLILNAAGHVKMEIPEHIEAARARHSRTEFVYAPHLGTCDPILAILKRRLHQAMRTLDMPDPKNTGVILLGRGSSDRAANGEVAKMARWLWEEGEHELVDIAFTGITHPRLERVVQRQARCGMTQIVVLPYYLFTGTLIRRIERQVEHLKAQYPHVRFARGDYFGFEEEIFQLVEQRVREARAGRNATLMPCDGCKYRALAAEHDHGHRHGEKDRRPAHSHEQETQAV
ncbi:MAG: sirohydrochlorin chelatase [Pseudomonadota bacterium]|jgi:sirohydrochlorin cobaltochelatase